jgi:hypothetical protein
MVSKSYKFKYVGDPNDEFSGPQNINQYGVAWTKGEVGTIDIDEDNERDQEHLQRLQGNSHFVDMSDKDEVKSVDDRLKAIDKREADEARAAEEQRKRDEADRKQMERNASRSAGAAPTAATAPRPPGKVTRDPPGDPFGGRTVEERTQAEDHTKAGKTKS